MKLFKEIQIMRKVAETFDFYSEAHLDDDTSGFLLMNYNVTERNLARQKTDTDLHNFLYKSENYELCCKTKAVSSSWNLTTNASYRARGRPFQGSKAKMFADVK